MSNTKTFQDWSKELLPVVQAAAEGASIEVCTRGTGLWVAKVGSQGFNPNYKYRVAPKTIRIGDYDVPEPMREAPDVGTTYYTACTMDKDLWGYATWVGDNMDTVWLLRGVVHSTKEAAVLHSRALVSLTQGK